MNTIDIDFNPAFIDASSRIRVSEMTTLGDYRQIHDDEPLFFDQKLGPSGGTAVYEQANGGVLMSVSDENHYVVRQTKMSHNYAAGKSQLIEFTTINFHAEPNVTKRAGYFKSAYSAPYSSNFEGIFFQNDGIEMRIRIVKNGVDVLNIPQSQWDDPLNGTGDSGYTVNWENFNVFLVDFLYLGGTKVRFAMVINGQFKWIHTYNHAGLNASTILTTPNLPIRYEIRATAASATGSFYHVSSQVSSEGSMGLTGIDRGFYTPDNIRAASPGVIYPLVALRLKTTFRDTSAFATSFSAAAATSDEFMLVLSINPTFTGASLSWSDATNSCLQVATPNQSSDAVTTITDIGIVEKAVSVPSSNSASIPGVNNLRIGCDLDGACDVLCLSAIPLGDGTPNLDVSGVINVRELV